MKDYFDPERYAVFDKETGEEMPVQIFLQDVKPEYWEKAYAKTLAEYFDLVGDAPTRVLTHILKSKDANNMVYGTVREFAESVGVAKGTISNVMKKLRDHGFIKMIRSGAYMLSPKVIKHGSYTRGAMVMRLWNESK